MKRRFNTETEVRNAALRKWWPVGVFVALAAAGSVLVSKCITNSIAAGGLSSANSVIDVLAHSLPFIVAILFFVIWKREIESKHKIEDREHKFRKATECMSDLVFEMDYSKGTIKWHGDASRKLNIADISAVSTVQGFTDRIHADDRSNYERVHDPSYSNDGTFSWIGRVTDDDGLDTYWDIRSVTLSGDPNDPKRIGACTNVSSMVTQRELAKNACRIAEEANRAKIKFLNSVSHELRTPLNVIAGMNDLMETEKLDERQAGYIKEVFKQSRQLVHIVDTAMQFTQLDSECYEKHDAPFRPDAVVESAFLPYAKRAEEKGIEAKCTIADNVPEIVVGDMVLLRWAVCILADNAVKFTHEGSISVSLRLVMECEDDLVLAIEVADTGCGMPNQSREEFKIELAGGGSSSISKASTGLGLTVLKMIAYRMGGRVSVEGKLGKGSIFTLYARLKNDVSAKNSQTA